jgi:hypothetical protein
MDLRNHLRVWWRWRRLLSLGLLLAVALGTLASFKPVLNGITPDIQWRKEAVYTSNARLFVTQRGFPWGRATLPGTQPGAAALPKGSLDFAAPDRFANLAIVYAYIAQSEQVRALIGPGTLADQIVVTPQFLNTGDPLPLLTLETKGKTPVAAQALNIATIKALREYLDREANQNAVPADQRVQVQVLNPPPLGAISDGRSPILSAVALVLMLVLTFTAVYILENLFPTVGVRLREYDDVPAMTPESAPVA